jgi:hypothetical protein
MVRNPKTTTSFRIDARTAEILRILNISFVKVFNRGLAALCIEKRITNPRVIQLLKRYYEEVLEDKRAEEEFISGILKDIENPPPSKVSMNPDDDDEPIIREERPEHIRPEVQEWLKNDPKYATHFLRNTLAHYLEAQLPKYNSDQAQVIGDLTMLRDDPGIDGIDREGLDILLLRTDIKSLISEGVKEALKVI